MGNQPIRTIIVDDESLARKRIIQVLNKTSEFEILDECSSGEEALQKIHKLNPDLIFLDIELGDMDGFTLLENIHLPRTPFVVFITAHEHFAQKAFDVLAFDYLLKPFEESRLSKTLLRVKHAYKKDESSGMGDKINALFRYIQNVDDLEFKPQEGIRFFPVKQSGKIHLIKIEDIMYIEASGYYVDIVTSAKKYLVRMSMTGMLEKLNNKNFIRIHRSVIIHLLYVKEIQKLGQNDYSVVMKNDQSFKISKSYKNEVFQRLEL